MGTIVPDAREFDGRRPAWRAGAHRLFRAAHAHDREGSPEEAVPLLRRAQQLAPGDGLIAAWAPRILAAGH